MNIPTPGGGGSGGSSTSISGNQYKYIPYTVNRNVYISRTVLRKSRTPDIGTSILVQLGGVFEKIGDEDEVIGGGAQKVGSGI